MAVQIACTKIIRAVVNNGQQSAIAFVQNKNKCNVSVQGMKLYGNFYVILFHKVCMPWQKVI